MTQTVILYHGSPKQEIVPTFGLGEEKHDYGKGFYLTENLELAKEWAVCAPTEISGWVHKYQLDLTDLKVLNFEKESILAWLAELMKHRQADASKRYRILSEKFIAKYGVDTSGYDVIKGWRASTSYFYIAKAFVRDEIDVEILEELMMLGGLGVQYCVKTERAYNKLSEIKEELLPVNHREFNQKYNERDICVRENMKQG